MSHSQSLIFCDMTERIDSTSKVPALQASYFAGEMNARKSLGGVVFST